MRALGHYWLYCYCYSADPCSKPRGSSHTHGPPIGPCAATCVRSKSPETMSAWAPISRTSLEAKLQDNDAERRDFAHQVSLSNIYTSFFSCVWKVRKSCLISVGARVSEIIVILNVPVFPYHAWKKNSHILYWSDALAEPTNELNEKPQYANQDRYRYNHAKAPSFSWGDHVSVHDLKSPFSADLPWC